MIRIRHGYGLGWQAARHVSPAHHVFGIVFGAAVLALIVVVVVFLAVWLIRHRKGQGALAAPGATGAASSPLDILKARYARGEIDKTEFEEKRRDIST